MIVLKRDGRQVEFSESNIKDAVLKAFNEVDGAISAYATEKAKEIARYVRGLDRPLTVEEIQDIVEEKLMASNRKDVARAYIIYRNDRNRERTRRSEMMATIREKLFASNVQNQNANVDEHSFGGRKGEVDSVIMKQYALDYCMSPKSRENHINNRIYIHDLDTYAVGMHNCLSVPFDDLLANGFNTRQTDVRPANSVNTAFQLVAVLFQLQSLQQFGGVSATHLDWTMVPYVKKSFYKHYMTAYLKTTPNFANLDVAEMLFDTYTDDLGIVRNRFDDWVDEHKDSFEEETGLSFEDVCMSNKANLDPALYNGAMFDTITETYQAAEGMYHNLKSIRATCQ